MKKIIRQKSLIENLMDMELNSSVEIHTKEYKSFVVRSTVYKLNKRGFLFTSTERGLIDRIIVTRLK